jgi:hypothetical protein
VDAHRRRTLGLDPDRPHRTHPRPGRCSRPDWTDGLCSRCWRVCRLFGRDPRLFTYEPLDGYRDERDAVGLPWERWESEARAGGASLADLLARPPDG